jgi:hypothetical protein
MNKTLIIKKDIRLDCDSFLIIRPKSNFYKVGEKFTIVDEEQLFQKIAYLKSAKEYSLSNLPEDYIFLDSNLNKSKYLQIQQQIFKSSERLTLQDYPNFLNDLQNVLGSNDYAHFENQIFKTFKPLKLVEILQLYEKQDYYTKQNHFSLKTVVEASFIEKKVNVLVFSSLVPEYITNNRMLEIKKNKYVKN